MRRLQLATFLFAFISLVATGCRQTTGPTNAGPLTPIGPLTPMGAGQMPTLGPFGGPTRVTPPPTGSYIAPNNYLGGVIPSGQANAGLRPTAGLGPQATGGVIGSGVQAAGWSETNSVAPINPGFTAQNIAGAPTLGVNSSAPLDPRRGGMQVIDLTGSPAPPGYRTPVPSFNNQLPGARPPSPNWQQSSPNQSFQNPPVQNSNGLRPITTPDAAQIAGGLAPMPTVSRQYPVTPVPVQQDTFPRTATGPTPVPSTEPVNSGNLGTTEQDLPWRRPGTNF